MSSGQRPLVATLYNNVANAFFNRTTFRNAVLTSLKEKLDRPEINEESTSEKTTLYHLPQWGVRIQYTQVGEKVEVHLIGRNEAYLKVIATELGHCYRETVK